MKVGSLVKRKPAFGEWVKMNPWMTRPNELETGIIIRIGRAGYWDYEVFWEGKYLDTHDESEIEEIKCEHTQEQ